MERPNNQDPVEWALYNAYQMQNVAVVSWPQACIAAARVIERETGQDAGELSLEPYEITPLGLPESFDALETAIHRAASELENQGEKSDRIATQLLTALAVFHASMGH